MSREQFPVEILRCDLPQTHRFAILEGSESGHDCCFGYTVVDTRHMDARTGNLYVIAECPELVQATLVVDALNAKMDSN